MLDANAAAAEVSAIFIALQSQKKSRKSKDFPGGEAKTDLAAKAPPERGLLLYDPCQARHAISHG
ncbi:hypothetical protein [Gluconacetobacter johannae]|uniref:Uncharacterized protein n=1 Tax=Gluconacetobacter johannae TaxID=112140 RepID=A0A7W4J9T0_9PROT|nr:hypothetical protein [Gluconacetobacter johannae]MBB2177316.1 hypothetical protein [Gluconacetobacter johannae]